MSTSTTHLLTLDDPDKRAAFNTQWTREYPNELRDALRHKRARGDKLADAIKQFDRIHVEIESPAAVLRAARALGAYNTFSPQAIARLLRGIDRLLPRKRFTDVSLLGTRMLKNPNDGMYDYCFTVGSEHSSVLYVHAGHYGGGSFTPEQVQVIIHLGVLAGADEYDTWNVREDGSVPTIRFWWD